MSAEFDIFADMGFAFRKILSAFLLTLMCQEVFASVPALSPRSGAQVVSGFGDFSVSGVCEDGRGYVWMASLSGLLRYDGRNTVLFSRGDAGDGALGVSMVNVVVPDSHGRLWCGTQRGIYRYDYGNSTFIEYPLSERMNYIITVFENVDGTVLCATRRALFQLNEKSGTFERVTVMDNSDNFTKLHPDGEGGLWQVSGRKFRHYGPSFTLDGEWDLPSRASNSCLAGGRLFFLADGGILEYDPAIGTLRPFRRDLFPRGVTFVGDSGDGGMVIAHNGVNWWLDVASGHLLSEADEGFPFFSPDGPVGYFFFRDSWDHAWTRCENGVCRFPLGQSGGDIAQVLSRLASRNPSGLVEASGCVWGLLDGGATLFRHSAGDGRVEEFPLSGLVGEGGLWKMGAVSDGFLPLICGKRVAVVATNGGTPELVGAASMTDEVYSMGTVLDAGGLVWKSGLDGRLYRQEASSGLMKPLRGPDFDGLMSLTAACRLSDGTLAFGLTDTGLLLVDPGTLRASKVALPLSSSQLFVASVMEDGKGRIWIGSTDEGLFLYDRASGQAQWVSSLGVEGILGLCEGPGGQVLAATADGVFRHDEASGDFLPLWKAPYDTRLSGSLLSVGGEAFLSQSGRYVPLFDKDLQGVAVPDFGLVLCDDRRVLDIVYPEALKSGRLRLKAPVAYDKFNVRFSPVSFSEALINFEFQADAGDGWALAEDNIVRRPELRYGRNRLSLRMKSIETGEVGQTCVLVVILPRPWYWCGVAKLLYGILAAALAVAFVGYRKKLKAKEFEAEMARRKLDWVIRESETMRHAREVTTGKEDMSGRDKAIMEGLYRIMEEDISEAELDVGKVTLALGIGRTAFYDKVKSLTGATPNEFFRAYKLNRAMELLESGEYKISAVAAMTGFSSPAHFSTTFKKHFGKSPSEVSGKA